MSKQEEDLQSIGELIEKRKRVITKRPYSTQSKTNKKPGKESTKETKACNRIFRTLEPKSCSNNMLHELIAATEEFDLI